MQKSFSCETRITLTFLFIAAFSSFSGSASEVPVGSVYDSRIQYVNYNAGDVVVLRTVTGVGSRIIFSKEEEILDVASGFSAGWEFEERRNILYVKARSIPSQEEDESAQVPVAGTWNTNLMVTTNKRLYDVDLQLLAGSSTGAPINGQRISYRVQYRYPEEVERIAAAKQKLSKTNARMGAKLPPRNWSYSMKVGDDSINIAPTAAYDDGRFTFLKFPGNRVLPLIYLRGPDGKESLINTHIDPEHPDYVVIHRVAPEFILRIGQLVVGVYNNSFDINGIPARSGSTVPGVKRTVKHISGKRQ